LPPWRWGPLPCPLCSPALAIGAGACLAAGGSGPCVLACVRGLWPGRGLGACLGGFPWSRLLLVYVWYVCLRVCLGLGPCLCFGRRLACVRVWRVCVCAGRVRACVLCVLFGGLFAGVSVVCWGGVLLAARPSGAPGAFFFFSVARRAPGSVGRGIQRCIYRCPRVGPRPFALCPCACCRVCGRVPAVLGLCCLSVLPVEATRRALCVEWRGG
jgi:hypothetical protein